MSHLVYGTIFCYENYIMENCTTISIARQIYTYINFIMIFQAKLLNSKNKNESSFFFSFIWVFFHEHLRITGQQGKDEVISLTPLYHIHPPHRRLDISRAIAAGSSPLGIASSRTRTRSFWFPSAGR